MKDRGGQAELKTAGIKVLMVLERDFPPDIRVENEMKILHNAGIDVTVASITFTHRPAYEVYPEYKVIRKPMHDLLYRSSIASLRVPFYMIFWKKYLDEILQKESYDVIHLHDLLLARVCLKLKEMYDLPLIIDLHENWPDHIQSLPASKTLAGKLLISYRQWLAYEKKMLSEADRIITVVEEMKERILEYGLERDRVFVFSNVFDPERLVLGNTPPDPRHITLYYAGGINYHRGLHIVVKGLKEVVTDHPEIRLWIAGKGKFEPDLKKLVHSLGLKDHVDFLGHLSQEETIEALSQVDITLIPHLRSVQTDNSSPNKLFQYMYAGKPLLVSDCISIRRIVEEQHCGMVYQNDSPEDFAQTLRLMIEGKEAWPAMGNQGRESVIRKYNLQKEAGKLLQVYESLLPTGG